ETALLTFDHVCQRFQRTLVGTGDSATATAVIQQSIYRFLQHTLFVTHDDVRRVEVQQALQTVVTVDDPTIQIVEVRCRETTTIQRNQRTQIRRQNRQNFKHHPLGLVAGNQERFQQLQTLGKLFDFGFTIGGRDFFPQLLHFSFEIDVAHQILDRFRTHLGGEFVTELFHGFEVLLVGEQLTFFQRGHAGIGHDIGFEVQNTLNAAQGHVQQQTNTAGQGFQKPDMRYWAGQFNMSHAITANLGQRYFYTAFLTNDAAVLHALVFTAQTFVVLDRTKDLRAEQTLALRFEGAIVDCFWLFDFTKGPRANHLRRCETNADRVKLLYLSLGFQQ